MGLLSGLAKRRRKKLTEFVEGQLEPGERLEAVIPMTQTDNPWFVGIALVSFFGLALTDRNLYLVTWAKSLPERPREITGKLPRAQLSVEEWKLGMTTVKLVLRSGEESLKLDVPGMHRRDGEAFVAVLSPGTVLAY